MDYTQPDYWATCAQLIIVLWLIIAVELRPSPEEIAKARAKAQQSVLLRGWGVYLRVAVLLMGVYSMIALFGVITVLSGVFEPTIGWAFTTGFAVLTLALPAMLGLIETAMLSQAPLIRKTEPEPPLEEE